MFDVTVLVISIAVLVSVWGKKSQMLSKKVRDPEKKNKTNSECLLILLGRSKGVQPPPRWTPQKKQKQTRYKIMFALTPEVCFQNAKKMFKSNNLKKKKLFPKIIPTGLLVRLKIQTTRKAKELLPPEKYVSETLR